jgi:DNA-directed RNA polymerase subunit beta
MGFIETPYRKVSNGKVEVKSRPVFLSAEEEDSKKIAQAKVDMDYKSGVFLTDKLKSRFQGDFPILAPGES